MFFVEFNVNLLEMKKAIVILSSFFIVLPFTLKAQCTNLATTASTTTTSNNTQSKMYLVDCNASTKWISTATANQNIDLTLLNAVRFITVKLDNVSAYNGFKIFVSPDNMNWFERASYDPFSTLAFNAVRSNIFCCVANEFKLYKYVRIQLRGYMGYASIGEISITEEPKLFKSFFLSGNYSSPMNIFDGDLSTAATNNNGDPRRFSLTLKETLQAAKVDLKTGSNGFRVDLYIGTTCIQTGYYYTMGGTENFLIVDPDGFDKIEFSAPYTSISIYDIKVEKKNLNTASLLYSYDDGGNMTVRQIVLATSMDSKIEENDTLIQLEPELKPIEDKFLSETFQIFPNPTKGKLKVVCKTLDPTKEVNIVMVNLNGVQLTHTFLVNGEAILDMNEQPSGTYFMNITVGDELHRWTIIKE